MKIQKLISIIALSLITANTVYAQQEEKTAIKPLPAALTKSPAADKPSASPVAKQIAPDAVQPATPSPATDAVKAEDMKGTEIKPGDKKGLETKNIDRPKTSTIEPEKKAVPAAKPKPVVAVPVEG
jgi:hypothetical protein